MQIRQADTCCIEENMDIAHTRENLDSNGVHCAEAKGIAELQNTCYRAHYWDVLVEVWILDSFESQITALAGVLQQHYRSIDGISPDLPLAARRSNPFLQLLGQSSARRFNQRNASLFGG